MSKQMEITRRRLLQSGGVVIISALIPVSLKAVAQALTPSSIPSVPSVLPAHIDSFLAIAADGKVTAYHGHVDLGTGIRTALTQVVADELEVVLSDVNFILGDTNLTADQGPTIASNTIQVGMAELRLASAQMRSLLQQWGAEKLSLAKGDVTAEQGYVFETAAPQNRVAYGDLVLGKDLHVEIDKETPLKPVEKRRYIGKPVERLDIPAKVTGELTYVHDMRVPDMLYAYVVRPPYHGADSSAPLGSSLISVDKSSIQHIPGIVDVVVINVLW